MFVRKTQTPYWLTALRPCSVKKTDTTKVAFLVNIGSMYGYAYGIDNEDSAFKYGQEALKLSKTTGYIKGRFGPK